MFLNLSIEAMGIHERQRWLDEAFGNLMKQNLQIPAEPNLLFVFIFTFLKPNQRFGGGRRIYNFPNNHERQMLYTSVLCAVFL
ncbi:hypothetical protein [Carboxylicivirga sp. M1479]|uniref:hypothetical protein n=1 Tax=Carboxylicivirga sp. M1479 TaxID=2594476 RepID=UPI001177FEFD|nr:hypothetical protein [Carboxylicivirga sp. M1479]TRX71253.1 hypothetical protein FNN09_07520 [Carboxylicivirga sp. M1479]